MCRKVAWLGKVSCPDSAEVPRVGAGAGGVLDESRLDELSRLAVGTTTRRLALGVAAAVGGLALAGEADAAKKGVSAEKWRRRRGRRGRRGKNGPEGPAGPDGPSGPTGPDGPPAGASVVVVPQDCVFPDVVALGATDACQASCPDGYVATGGGYQMGTGFFDSIGRVTASRPDQNGDDLPVGWTTEVEYFTLIGFALSTYAICVPE